MTLFIEKTDIPLSDQKLLQNTKSRSGANDNILPASKRNIKTNSAKSSQNSSQTAQNTGSQSQIKPSRVLSDHRSLQSKTGNIVKPEIDSSFLQKINANRFPKMLLLERDFKVNPHADQTKGEPVFENIFKLRVLDFLDVLTGNPKIYNIYVQENEIEIVTKSNIISSQIKLIRILTIFKIEENTIDASQKKEGSSLSFKSVASIPKIRIKFTLFSDWLGALGAYITICGVVATLAMSFFKDVILDSKIMHSTFKFIDNNEQDFKMEILNNGVNKYTDMIHDSKEKKNNKLNKKKKKRKII